jgi:hypothetical protein
VNEDLALAIDFEDGAAAISDEQIAFGVECSTGGNTHAFDILGEFARGIDAPAASGTRPGPPTDRA